MELVSPSQMREIDRTTIEEIGVPGIVLMERASLGAVEHLLNSAPAELDRVGIVCGGGNNGGDGLAMGRLLSDREIDVVIVLLGHPEEGSDAHTNLTICQNLSLEIIDLSEEDGARCVEVLSEIAPPDVWCDAIFGTGLDRPIEGKYRDVVEWLAAQPRLFGVDIPSGIDGSTGQILGCATKCFATATFGLPKLGQAVEPGRSHCGELHVVDIGIPPVVFEQVRTSATWLTSDLFHLPPRPRNMHKGDAGRVIIVGGATGTTGASLMAAQSALRSGAGLVTIAAPPEAATAIHAALPQVMALDWTSDELASRLDGADVVVAGPGMGQSDDARRALRRAISSSASLILDADALNLIATGEVELTDRAAPTFLTPHPGEAARLLGDTAGELLAAPYHTARRLASNFDAVAIFKSSCAIIAGLEELAVNASGNPGMATGGMGDSLCGILAARACVTEDPFEAACEAVFAHGMAADIAAERNGERGLTVDDLLMALPKVWLLWESR